MRSRGLVVSGGLVLLLALAACDAPGGSESAGVGQADYPILYGPDDRTEVYSLTDPALLALASSTLALVDDVDVDLQSDGSYVVAGDPTLGVAWHLCPDEPFADQPTAAFCTGFLVGADLVATAGHCIDATSCPLTTFVFDYHMLAPGVPQLHVPASAVYACAQVVTRVQTATNDYAIVRLDRPAEGRTPLALRRSGAVATGAPLVVAGHPSGLPMKVADNASVRNASPADYFEANLDTYGGNSGSPVVNTLTHEVEGILVRGNTDYTYLRKQRCYVSNTCPDTGCPGWEEVTRAAKFAGFVPEPCAQDADCTDGNACTADTCGAAAVCVFAPVVCPEGEVCTDGACVPVPVCAAKGQYCAAHATCCSSKCNLAKHVCR